MEPHLSSPEKRRTEVELLLREGSNAKLQWGSTDCALELLAKAHQLAHEPSKLLSPWPELTSYRLAHLRLRRTSQTLEDLLEIDELLAESARRKELGPWPRLYRLAVLHRIRLADESIVDQKSVDTAFRLASDAISKHMEDAKPADRARLQDPLLNSLELCVYFLGRPYAEIEGLRGTYDETLGEHENWSLVGPDPDIARIRYSRAFALVELNAVADEHPSALRFCIGKDGGASWWQGQQGSKRKLRKDTAKLLAHLLRWPDRPARCALDESVRPDAKRKSFERFREDLANITGLSESEFFGDGEGGLRLPEGVVIYGACSPSAWR